MPCKRVSTGRPARIWIIGHPGSGKTTLGRQLSQAIEAPLLELDSVLWLDKWQKASDDLFDGTVTKFIANNPSWVIDGMYRQSGVRICESADLVIFLNRPLLYLLRRVFCRSFLRVFRGTELWNGNRETFAKLFGRDSILLYTLSSYRQKMAEAEWYLSHAKKLGIAYTSIGTKGSVAGIVGNLRGQG